jgi:hypothetical protein
MQDLTQPITSKVELSDGTIILMEVNNIEEDGAVSVQGLIIAAQKTFAVVSSLAKDIKETLVEAKPDKATVEFSIELEKKDGDIMSKICNINGKGGIKFTLEWDFSKEKKV